MRSVRVKDIILNSIHPMSEEYGGEDAIGTITFQELTGNPLNTNWLPNHNVAKPIFSFIKNFPLKNEIVIIIEAVDDSIYGFSKGTKYYFPALNIWNHPHHNALPPLSSFRNNQPTINDYQQTENGLVRRVIDEGTDIELGRYFEEKINIKPLLPYEGDIILEGRFGNSIRFSSTVNHATIPSKNENQWSNTGSFGDPIIIIRNGQKINEDIKEEQKGWVNTLEDINNDDSSIYLTSNQQITDFQPASINKTSFGAPKTQTPWETKLNNPFLNRILSPKTPPTSHFKNVQEDPILSSPIKKIEYINPLDSQKIHPIANIVETKTDLYNENIEVENIILNEETKPPLTNNPSGSLEMNGGLNQKIGKYFTLKQLIFSKRFTSNTPLEDLINQNNKQATSIIKVKNPKNDIEKNITGNITAEWSSDNASLKSSKGIEYSVTAELKGFPDGYEFSTSEDISGMMAFHNNENYTLEALMKKAINIITTKGTDYFRASYNDTDPKDEKLNIDLEGRLITKGGIINNYPGVDIFPTGEEIFLNLQKVMINCIDPLISNFPDIEIISAYRSKELNKSIGGAPADSEHIRGQAIDIYSPNAETSEIFNWCVKNLPEWNNLLWAYPEREELSWIHISYIEGNNNKNTTMASEIDSFHEYYGGIRRGNRKQYQDNVLIANIN